MSISRDPIVSIEPTSRLAGTAHPTHCWHAEFDAQPHHLAAYVLYLPWSNLVSVTLVPACRAAPEDIVHFDVVDAEFDGSVDAEQSLVRRLVREHFGNRPPAPAMPFRRITAWDRLLADGGDLAEGV